MTTIPFLEKWRPALPKDVYGQADVVRAVQMFLKDPRPAAMLFHGETGTGKTTMAYAIARALGVSIEDEELGGFHEIVSGEQNGERVRRKMDNLRLGTLFGSGWKVLVVNEADRMSEGAESVWFDALEARRLPPRSVVIFTTNFPAKIAKTIRDRCKNFAFESDPAKLRPAIVQLAKRVWKEEGLKGPPPALDTLGLPTCSGGDLFASASFRLAMQQLEEYVTEAKLGKRDFKRVQKRLAKDLLVETELVAECDHCGKENDVRPGSESHRCVHCGEIFSLEMT